LGNGKVVLAVPDKQVPNGLKLLWKCIKLF
jgi:hypothetical protein